MAIVKKCILSENIIKYMYNKHMRSEILVYFRLKTCMFLILQSAIYMPIYRYFTILLTHMEKVSYFNVLQSLISRILKDAKPRER